MEKRRERAISPHKRIYSAKRSATLPPRRRVAAAGGWGGAGGWVLGVLRGEPQLFSITSKWMSFNPHCLRANRIYTPQAPNATDIASEGISMGPYSFSYFIRIASNFASLGNHAERPYRTGAETWLTEFLASGRVRVPLKGIIIRTFALFGPSRLPRGRPALVSTKCLRRDMGIGRMRPNCDRG